MDNRMTVSNYRVWAHGMEEKMATAILLRDREPFRHSLLTTGMKRAKGGGALRQGCR